MTEPEHPNEEEKEPLTSKEALTVIYFFSAIAAIPVGIWAYKSSDDWLGLIARFVAIELIVFVVVFFIVGFLKGLASE